MVAANRQQGGRASGSSFESRMGSRESTSPFGIDFPENDVQSSRSALPSIHGVQRPRAKTIGVPSHLPAAFSFCTWMWV